MSASNCLTEETVSRFVEGSLEAEELARTEAHMAGCDACMRLVADVGGILARTAGIAETEMAPSCGDEIPLAKGDRVGRYVIEGVLGAGAMGRVYAALDPSLDRRVALKLLHPHAGAADLEPRLLREAKAMARLSHPDVITVHDAGRHGDRLFIAMELVDGGTLREWLGARRRTRREILGVFLRAGRGLAEAHAAGITHRDFKPDNVLVGADGRVRVTDFGLARTAREKGAVGTSAARSEEEAARSGSIDPAFATRTGTLLGTPAYMAPEQLAGEPADARSDVYGFCVSLYEALYGERPFPGKTLAAIQREKIAGEIPLPRDAHDVPPRLRRAILVGLRPRPEDRYASMDALLDAITSSTRVAPRALAASAVVVLAVGGLAAGRGAKRAATVSAADAGAATSTKGCSSDRACVDEKKGGAFVCRHTDGACVPLASEDCVPMFEPDDVGDEGTVWLGAMFPTKGSNAFAYGAMNMKGADLARREIARATSALTGAGASRRIRKIALVGCDDSQDPMRAARHLVDDVGVPAILGFGSGKELEDVAGSLLVGRRVLSMSTLTGNPLVTRLPQPADLPRMVWRTTYSIEASADATAHFVHDVLEPRRLVVGEPRETRVTLARVDANMGSWFGEALYRGLVFNGKPAVENGANYQEVTFPGGATDEELSRVADRIAQGSPSFVILLGGSAETDALVRNVEARWKSGARPTYLFGADSIDPLAPFLGKNIDRRRRVLGVSSLSSQTSNARFLMRFEAAHPGEATLTMNPSPTYDAFYLLAWATFALGDRPVTGPALGRAFARLVPPGRPIEDGPSDLFDGIATLAKGESIDLNGPSGSLDFDLTTGESPADFALLCSGTDRDGNATHDVESGVVYRVEQKNVEGAMRCP